MLTRFFAWISFAAAFLFIVSLTVFSRPGFPVMSPDVLSTSCARTQNCPTEKQRGLDAVSQRVVASDPRR